MCFAEITSRFNRMFGHASGASNGSTSSSPFFRTQYSSPFGTAVGNSNAASGASNGSTSPSPFFRTQYSSPFGTAVGNSNAASGALNGSTSAPSVFANQSLNPFGVGTASNGSTSAPFVFANQSLNTFGIGTAGNNTSPFVQSSPSYPRFGEGASTVSPFGSSANAASCASFGRTSSSPFFANQSSGPFGTAVGATTVSPFCSSANAASCASFGCTSSSPFFANQSSGPFGTPVGAATVSPFGSSTNAASCAAFGCTSSSPFFANQSSGPFGTAVATNADPFGQSSSRFTGFVDRTNASTSGQTSSSFGGFGVALPATAPFTTPASTLQPSIFRPGGGGPATADNSCGGTRAPYQPTPAEEDHPSWNNHNLVLNSISAMNCYCNKSHEELRLEDYKQTRNGGLFSASHVPGVSNPLSSHVSWLPPPCEPLASTFNRSSENPIQRTDPSSSLDSDKDRTTPVQTSPVQTSVAQTLPAPTPTTTTTMSNQTINVNLNDTTLSITVSGGASFIPITLAFIPQYPQVSNPTTALPLLHPEITLSNPCMLLLNPTSSASTTNPANAHLSTIAETTSHVSPSAGVLGEQITNPSPSAPPAPTNAAPSGSASSFKLNLPATQHSSSIPKGLEIIVEQLGFNPWEGKSHLQDSKDGQILLCEDASDDADIFSLAEFAVEQHNAMEQDRKVELLKVTAACLETVDGGRYHIVLEAKMGKAASSGVCVYAVVLRKKTDRPTPLIVLERWLFNSRFD
ncbi:uncharacterized protein LOC141652507 isoform X4 [Silene latifolia]|uniref:uncharacterized protein LOC141652507 isoform X4 n=1 Tax=Silene latifolia TaxID=37657 RepID=UPI003D78768F